jgi:(2R)-sulfolactate sulfo-lyase subunit alpha
MIQFLAHEEADNVGVATVDIKAGETAQGLFMDTQEKIEMKALQDIPLGHKIALTDLKVEESVIKYGHDIGKVVADIKAGEHDLKTRRW